ncbi:MAG TPA: 1-acyl-sn-glycerol-3-phosphate acyltransferase [Dehalococcoidia bacterium]|nr:1-acyl-sn-glycerol-3-phosphate acyltransferase [Dehalococcoidia bacterium]
MRLSHRAAKAVVKPLFKVLIRLEVKGEENMPPKGPLIVLANHLHWVDPVLLLVSFPWWINFMAKEELFYSRPLSLFFSWAQASPVRRKWMASGKIEALQWAEAALKEGLVLGMFPEGKRSREARLLLGRRGPALIALKTGAPLLPIGICGTEKLKGIGWLRRPRITINIGQSFTPPSVNTEPTKPQLRWLADFAMEQIAALLPTEYRGRYKVVVGPSVGIGIYGEDRN